MNPWLEFLRQMFGGSPMGQQHAHLFDPMFSPSMQGSPMAMNRPMGGAMPAGPHVMPDGTRMNGNSYGQQNQPQQRQMPTPPASDRAREVAQGRPFQAEGQMPGQRMGQLRNAPNMGMKKSANGPQR